jgi:hypothetical protein
MLTNIAQYYEYTKDHDLILKHLPKIAGLGRFLNRRYALAKAAGYPPSDSRYGMPNGNDEADMFFGTVVGYNTELPFISIAAEMWRGLRDCGNTLARIAALSTGNDAVAAREASEMMLGNTASLLAGLKASMEKDKFVQDGNVCHPYAAGVPACGMLFATGNTTTSSPRDSESWRTYSEAMYSGALDDQTIVDIVAWHQTHGSCGKQPCHAWNSTASTLPMINGSMLKAGVPAGSGGDVENGDQMMTFTVHGWGAGLLQADLIEAFLVHYFALSAHAYTRGSWIAPESTVVDRNQSSVSFCTPATLTAPILLKWLLVWEHPVSHTVWLGRAIPRDWLSEGETVAVAGAGTACVQYRAKSPV